MEEFSLAEARKRLLQATAKIGKKDLQELKSMSNPPQMIKNIMIWFGSFYKMEGTPDHTWNSVVAFLLKPDKLLKHLANFDYDSISGPAMKKFKTQQMYSNEEVATNSMAILPINNLLLMAQEYYLAKTSNA